MKKLLSFIFLFLLIPSLCFGAAAYMHVTSGGAGNRDGTDWDNAFRCIETGSTDSFENDVETAAEAGDVYYIKDGTCTLTSDITTALDGSNTAPIKIIGVLSTTTNEGAAVVSSDWAYGTDRPLFDDAAGDYRMIFDDYWNILNIRTSLSGAGIFRVDLVSIVFNSDIYYESTGNSHVLTLGAADSSVIYSTIRADGSDGGGITSSTGNHVVYGCFMYGLKHGILWTNNGPNTIVNNIFSDGTNGVYTASYDEVVITLNTFYNCTTGINATDAGKGTFVNNLFDEVTAPITFSVADPEGVYGWNSYDGDESSNTNVVELFGSIDVDITLTDPTGSPPDFTVNLATEDATEDVGLMVDTNTGVAVDMHQNIGADQTDTQSGGASRRFIMIAGDYDLDNYLNNIDPRTFYLQ